MIYDFKDFFFVVWTNINNYFETSPTYINDIQNMKHLTNLLRGTWSKTETQSSNYLLMIISLQIFNGLPTIY